MRCSRFCQHRPISTAIILTAPPWKREMPPMLSGKPYSPPHYCSRLEEPSFQTGDLLSHEIRDTQSLPKNSTYRERIERSVVRKDPSLYHLLTIQTAIRPNQSSLPTTLDSLEQAGVKRWNGPKIIVSDGTNWLASTELHPVPGATGHLMISDGTNWLSSAMSADATITSAGVISLANNATARTNIGLGTAAAPYFAGMFLSNNVTSNLATLYSSTSAWSFNHYPIISSDGTTRTTVAQITFNRTDTSDGGRSGTIVMSTSPTGGGLKTALTLGTDQSAVFASSIKTSAPAGGTAAAATFGIYVGTPTVSTGYIQIDLGGTLYEVPAKVH